MTVLFNTINEAFLYLEGFTNLERNDQVRKREYRLDRMVRLLSLFDQPDKHFKCIHVAGSKGKGSTAAFMAAGLSGLGYKTGLYTSPHVESYTERFRIMGQKIPDSMYREEISRIKSTLAAFDDNQLPEGAPTTFELLTLLAFLLFKRLGCEWVVLETGLGGRLDATNVVIPEAAVLTPIELEHCDFLGNTIPQIAGEKAGIIKKGIPVFSSVQKQEARDVFIEKSAEKNSPLTFIDELVNRVSWDAESGDTVIEWKTGDIETFHQALPGDIQAWNAVLAYSVLKYLFPETSTHGIIKQGFADFRFPGRMEIIKGQPDYILDGAHTVDSIIHLIDTVMGLYKKGAVLILGVVDGKALEDIADRVAGCFSHIIVSKPGTFKKSNPEYLYSIIKEKMGTKKGENMSISLEIDPEKALSLAHELSKKEHGVPILITGSFYLLGEFRQLCLR